MPKAKRKPISRSHSRPRPKTKIRLSKSTAIVPVTPRPVIVQKNRERQLTGDEIELLKRTVCKGADNDEFALFLWTCKKHKLDPITRQIYAVFRNVSKHHQDEKGIWVSGRQMTIQMGIDGLRALAGRHHRDFGGCDEPTFVMTEKRTPAGRQIPDSATVRLWKKGLEHPIVGSAYWDEFAPRDLAEAKADFYNRMPRHMLAKCAEALAIRKGYPDLSDIYTEEEMVQADQNYTPEGRIITDANGFSPSGTAIIYEAQQHGSRAAAQAVAARKIAEANAERKPLEVEIVDEEPKEYQGAVEIDWTEEGSPIVRGDIGKLLELLQKHCTMTWGKDEWWHCLPKDAETIREMCRQFSFRLTEVMPKKVSPRTSEEQGEKGAVKGKAVAPKPARTDAAPVTSRKETKPAASAAPSVSAEPQIVKGTIQHFTEKMTKGSERRPSAPYLNVLLKTENGDRWYSMFDRDLFEYISKAKGKSGEFLCTQSGDFWNIVGLKTLAGKQFEDGKLPVVSRDREPGAAGNLFNP